MAKTLTTAYVCQSCGEVHSKWSGKCNGCGEWNTLVEENAGTGIGAAPGAKTVRKGSPVQLVPLSGEIEEAPRVATGIAELDRDQLSSAGKGIPGQAERDDERQDRHQPDQRKAGLRGTGDRIPGRASRAKGRGLTH